jgi:hypothetical protein
MKPLVIFSIYRTNETPNSFIDQLEDEIVQCNEDELFILGDLNIDQIGDNINGLKPLMRRTGVKQLITEPTRVTEVSRTLLDVILTNSPHCNSSNAGVIKCVTF